MKVCQRREIWLHSILTLVRDGDEWLPPCHGWLTPRKKPQYALKMELSRPHSWFVQVIEEKHLWPIPDCPGSCLVTTPTVLPGHSFYCWSKHFNKSCNSQFAVTLPTFWSHLERFWFCTCFTQTMGILCTHSEHILLGRSQTRNWVRQGVTSGKQKWS